jgi:hypothetical protein
MKLKAEGLKLLKTLKKLDRFIPLKFTIYFQQLYILRKPTNPPGPGPLITQEECRHKPTDNLGWEDAVECNLNINIV